MNTNAAYDSNSNMTARTLDNGTSSSYGYDALDRVTHIAHALVGTTRTFGYDYDNVGNRKWAKRDGGNGDRFDYDDADQAIVAKLDIANPDTANPGSPTIVYDADGNRTSFAAYGPTDTYTINDLNQYTKRNTTNAAYDLSGNMTTGLDGSSYPYDALNRLTSATKGGTTMTFKYDGLNRQVSRKIGTNGTPTYNVYDGWDLIAEYAPGAISPSAAYLTGTGGIVKNLISNKYYYQDASGSTSHLAGGAGSLVEWYRYDLQGTPIIYDANNNQRSTSAYGVRHLFTGQQWYAEIGLYDLRNRFYSPDTGRFLQPDPIGFSGDATNLYRYCGNNPLTHVDPNGTLDAVFRQLNIFGVQNATRVQQQLLTPLEISAAIGVALGWNPEVGITAIVGFGFLYYQTYEVLHGGGAAPDEVENNNPEAENPMQHPIDPDFDFLYLTPEYDSSGQLNENGPQNFNYVVMSDGTIYKYNPNWQYIGHIPAAVPLGSRDHRPAGSSVFSPTQWGLTGRPPSNPVDRWDPYAGEFSPGGDIPIGVYSGAMGLNWGGSGGGGCHWFNPGPL